MAELCYIKSEWKWKVAQSCLTLCDIQSPWNSPGQNTGVSSLFILQGIFPTEGSNPGLSLALQVDSLWAETHGKPKNTGVGSLSLLQQIFPTQELDQGLLHYRWILYQLSYQGNIMMAYIASVKNKSLDFHFITCFCDKVKYMCVQKGIFSFFW